MIPHLTELSSKLFHFPLAFKFQLFSIFFDPPPATSLSRRSRAARRRIDSGRSLLFVYPQKDGSIPLSTQALLARTAKWKLKFSALKKVQKIEIPLMLTLDKKQSAKYFLLELLSEQTRLREAATILKRKYGTKLEQEWSAFGEESIEETNFYDDWMEYQSIKMVLKNLANRILEIRRGDFSFA